MNKNDGEKTDSMQFFHSSSLSVFDFVFIAAHLISINFVLSHFIICLHRYLFYIFVFFKSCLPTRLKLIFYDAIHRTFPQKQPENMFDSPFRSKAAQ